MVSLGHVSLLVPRDAATCSECASSPRPNRAARAARELGLSEKEALARVHRDDESTIRWAEYLLDADPWDAKPLRHPPAHGRRPRRSAAKFIAEQAQGWPPPGERRLAPQRARTSFWPPRWSRRFGPGPQQQGHPGVGQWGQDETSR